MKSRIGRSVVALACLVGCGVDAEPPDAAADAEFDAAWAFEKAQFTKPWAWTLTADGAVASEGVMRAEVRQEHVVFHDAAPCPAPHEAEWCAAGLGEGVEGGAIVVPLTDHVDPPGASTVRCAGGEGQGCDDTAGVWYERELMVWTDALDAHVLKVAARTCGEEEGGAGVVSFARDEGVLVWEVDRGCGGEPGDVVRVELRR